MEAKEERPTSNVQRPTFNVQRPTSNVQRPTPNAERRAPNAQRPTSNAEPASTADGLRRGERPTFNAQFGFGDQRPPLQKENADASGSGEVTKLLREILQLLPPDGFY